MSMEIIPVVDCKTGSGVKAHINNSSFSSSASQSLDGRLDSVAVDRGASRVRGHGDDMRVGSSRIALSPCSWSACRSHFRAQLH